MKKIVCEMCGSNDLLKKDGVFECQSCGTKYSVEEAKKMMVDGVVNVEGTVQIDDSNKISNLIKNAKILFKDGKTDEAYKLFGDVLNIDTENYTAITYRGLCSAWHTSINSPKISDAVTGISRGFEIAKNVLGETEEYAKFCMEILEHMSKISVACMNLYKEHYVKAFKNYEENLSELSSSLNRSGLYADVDWYRKRGEQEEARLKSSRSIAVNGIHLTLVASNVVAVKIITVKNIEIYSIKDYNIIKDFIVKYMVVPHEYLNNKLDDYLAALGMMVTIDKRIKEIGDKKRDAYWKEHAEEKEKLESEINDLKNDIKNKNEKIKELSDEKKKLEKKMNSEVPSELDLKKLASKLEDLKNEKSSLGLFKGKEKKVVQEKIDEVEEEIEKINDKVVQEKNELKNKYGSDITSLDMKIEKLNKEKEKLKKNIEKNEFELKKERD